MERTYLTDTQRDAIDQESKSTVRELDNSIRQIDDVEKIRIDTERQIAFKKYGRGTGIGGALGRWAAGGMAGENHIAKSQEQVRDEQRRSAFDTHRKSVLWYLRQRLDRALETQRKMMEQRVEREIEKSKSVLWKVKKSAATSGQQAGEVDDYQHRGAANGSLRAGSGFDPTTEGSRISDLKNGEAADIEARLSPEQLALFVEENNDMLKRYEDTLDQIR